MNPSSYPVYTGIWTNWSYGPIFGPTLTLSQTNGTLLIAFVAFFVTMVGTQLWRVLCFCLHHLFSAPTEARDGLHHQRQAILRNSSNPAEGALRFFRLFWNWRKVARRPGYRVLPILFATCALTGGFIVASGFSAKVALGNEVVISSPNCGVQQEDLFPDMTQVQLLLVPAWKKEIQIASNYAQQCYSGSTTTGALGCNTFIRQQIPFSIQTNSSCPFAGSICRSNDSNLILDTGLINSHDDLGVNAPDSQRFQFRRRYHCAPLETDNYTTTWNSSDSRPYTRFHYGKNFLASDNYTFETLTDPMVDARVLNGTGTAQQYGLSVKEANRFNGSLYGTSTFKPISELVRPDADVFIFFLSTNGIQFDGQVNDPWFKATKPAGTISRPGDPSMPIWQMDNPGSPMACVAQDQWCNPSTGKCTDLIAYRDAATVAEDLFPDEDGSTRYEWFFNAGINVMFGAETAITYMGAATLTANFKLVGGISEALPDNQWQLEVQSWFATMLANLQKGLVNTATGPSDQRLDSWQLGPNNTIERGMCGNQKILSTAYNSFSLFGLLFIFILGFIITAISLSIESLAGCVQQRRKNNPSYSLLEWSLNDTLQLQRLAHEELGFGRWGQGLGSMPVTEKGSMLAILDASDPKHPRLKQPRIKEMERTNTGFSEGQSTLWSTQSGLNSPSSPKLQTQEHKPSAFASIVESPPPPAS